MERQYFYIKLSCPSTNEDSDFKTLFLDIKSQKISTHTIQNVPNSLDIAKINDITFIHMGGDAGNKRKHFKKTDYPSFDNGWYALGVIKEILPDTKSITLQIFPFGKGITKAELLFYPQFMDNLGPATKGIPNQSGLYKLKDEIAKSFLDLVIIKQKASKNLKNELQGVEFEGELKKGVNDFITSNSQTIDANHLANIYAIKKQEKKN